MGYQQGSCTLGRVAYQDDKVKDTARKAMNWIG